MISYQRLLDQIFHIIISTESSISRVGTSSWLRLICLKAMRVKVHAPVWVAQDVLILNPKNLTLGKNACIGEGSKIICHSPISIGDYFLSSCELNVNSGTHDPVTLKPIKAPVKIGDRVWVGARVTICPGVTIGDDVVIGTGSVVVKDLPNGCIAYGVPATAKRDLNRGDLVNLWSSLDRLPFHKRLMKKLALVQSNNHKI